MLWAAHHGAQRLIQPGHARRLAGTLSIAGLHQRRHGQGKVPALDLSHVGAKWFVSAEGALCAGVCVLGQEWRAIPHDERLCRLRHIAVDALGNAPASGIRQRALALEDGRRGNAPVDALGRSAPGLESLGHLAALVGLGMGGLRPADGQAITAGHQE